MYSVGVIERLRVPTASSNKMATLILILSFPSSSLASSQQKNAPFDTFDPPYRGKWYTRKIIASKAATLIIIFRLCGLEFIP